MTDGELEKQIVAELLQYKAELNQGLNQLASGKSATELSAERLLHLIKQNSPQGEVSSRSSTDSSIPDDSGELREKLTHLRLTHEYYGKVTHPVAELPPIYVKALERLIQQQRQRWGKKAYKRGVIAATGGYSYQKPMKSMRTRSTAFKLYAVKFFNGEIKKRRELLLASLAAVEGKEDV